ncbi:MAG: PLP-dependent transferase [Actinomycetales bacterium]|nr:PLP-dependent transferase [Actinomycetales bacterium]
MAKPTAAVSGTESVRTTLVTAGRPERLPDAALNQPVVLASSFIAGGPLEYAREGTPSTASVEDLLGRLEHGLATVFSSGIAAANAAMDLVPMGGLVVAPSAAYTGVAVRLRELAQAGRIRLAIVEADDTEAVAGACADASLLWLESPTNPLLQVADLEACITAAQHAGAQVLVDNTFATPMLQRPLELGADYVLHSVTKALSGHSDLLLGALVVQDPAIDEQIRTRRVLLGAAPGGLDCYLALRGMRTLALRVEQAQQSARAIVDLLHVHPGIARVRYPGFGTIAAIEPRGCAEVADAVCSATRIWTYATSLGGVESLLERRRRWPLESSAVPENLIRLSFGIEATDDLWADLDQAIRSAT